ncbi:MAG: hypothetical protein JXB88_00115 [Spirochaetales bacterium]|nr:hypothetical protein [Spirochaetales bacterium]
MSSNTLADVLKSISRFLPETLLSSLSWQRVFDLAGQLPALLCPYSFGFEMPLHQPLQNVDFAFCITQPGCDILTGIYPLESRSELTENPRIWPGIKNFCKVWGNPGSGPFRRVENLWLEFRPENRNFVNTPVPFIKMKDPAGQETWLPDSLEMLYGKRIPERVKHCLSCFLKNLSPKLRPFQAGIYEQDGRCHIRLCLEGLMLKELPGFLKRTGLELPHLDDDVLSTMERICVHIDIGETMGQTIGIELRQDPGKELDARTQPEWDRVLDLLEQKGLCRPGNNAFLKEFRGYSYEMIHPDLAPFITFRFLYYLKVVYTPGEPAKVKAYFGFVNRTVVPAMENKTYHFIFHKQLSQEIIHGAIRKGITFLSLNQLPHGEFNTYISGDMEMRTAEYDSSPFVTAFVLYCTRHISDELFYLPRQRAGIFLHREGLPGYLWKYWTYASGRTIVPDTDDTCCISFIMQELFHLDEVKRNIPVILSNRDKNELFNTWIKEPHASNDTDIVVNANILLYLGNRKETKAAIAFIKECIVKGEEKKHYQYYLNNLACYYMVSRAAIHGIHDFKELFPVMKERILESRNPEGTWGDALSTALALCSLHNMEVPTGEADEAFLRLMNRQQANGAWGRSAFYAGPEPPGPHSVWFGSEELTTAFCLEVLTKRIGSTR